MSGTSGAITGVVSSSASGTYSFNVTVSDNAGSSISSNFTIVISTAVVINTNSLAAAALNSSYTGSLSVSGGSGSYTITASGMPTGLSVNPTSGVISGTPTVSGAYSVGFTVTDSNGLAASKTLTLNVVTPPSITTSTFAATTAGAVYSTSITAANGVPPYTYSISSGSLPAGLTLSSAGVISGTVSYGSNVKNSPFTFTVLLTDSAAETVSKTFTMAVTIKPWIPGDADRELRVGAVGVPYAENLFRIGGVGTLTYSASGLPAGLSINSSTGLITGTPTTSGTTAVSFTLTDSKGATSTTSKNLKVVAAGKSVVDLSSPITTGLHGQTNNGQFNGSWPYPYKIAAGDLNGDGNSDVVWTQYQNNRIILMFGNGDGSFTNESEQVNPDSIAYDAKVADFDGDGKMDVLISTNTGGRIVAYKGDNVWANNSITGMPINLGGQINEIAVADLNGDGATDIVAAGYGNNVIYVIMNCRASATVNYGGTSKACTAGTFFNYYVTSFALSGNPNGITLADMSRPMDGKIDLIIGTWNGYLYMYKGNGDGTFGSPSSVSTGYNICSVRTGVVFGTNPQVIALNNGSLHKIYNTSGSVTFNGSSVNLDNTAAGGGCGSVDVADVNGDGYADIAIAQTGIQKDAAALFLGSLSGTLTRTALSPGYQPYGLVFGNFSGQTLPDLAIARGWWQGWSELEVFRNNGLTSGLSNGYYLYASPPNNDVSSFGEPVVADLNRDGYPDFIVKMNGASSVFANNGNGTVSLQTTQISNGETSAWTWSHTQHLWDFNGDGLWDYVSVTGNGGGAGTAVVSLGNGDLSFGSQFSFAVNQSGCLNNLGARSVDVADVNLDGIADIVVATGCSSAPGSQVYIYYGYGDGTFNTASPTILSGVSSYADSVIARDFNNDGFIDIIIADNNGWIKVYRGTGAGTFAAPSQFNAGVGYALYNLQAVDLNNDGIVDLVVAPYGNSSNYASIIFNSSLTVAAQTVSVGNTNGQGAIMNSRWMTTGDVNADGKIDVILGKNYGAGYQVLLGNGDGTFQSSNANIYMPSNPGPYTQNQCSMIDLSGQFLPSLVCAEHDGGYGVGLMPNRSR